eukprot:scaffold44293_cov69-Phaeocystis_antarctica.AAC.3
MSAHTYAGGRGRGVKVKVKMKFFFLDDARQASARSLASLRRATRDTSADLVLPSKQIARRLFE